MQNEQKRIPLIETVLYYTMCIASLGSVWVLKTIIRRAIVEATSSESIVNITNNK